MERSIRQEADALADQIMKLRRFGKEPGVTVSSALLDALGHPEQSFRIVHIAGTNGKGSTASFLASILRAAGLRTGLFTSPHLQRFDERIQVDGVPIDDGSWLRLGHRVLQTPCHYELTMFDCCLEIGLLFFAEQQCDIVVLETGLGGTLDSTNAISRVPELSIVTNIGFDHTAVLGNTLGEIASNKAGILKPGTYAVFAKMEEEALRVLQSRCRELGISYAVADNPESVLRGVEPEGDIPVLGLNGAYQMENAATAVLAARQLFRGADEAALCGWIRTGLANASWPGRMERLPLFGESENSALHEVRILLDGAHNPQGITALCESLKQQWPGQRFLVLMGVVADKDYSAMTKILAPVAEEVYAVSIQSDRTLAADQLAGLFEAEGITARAFDRAEDALAAVRGRVLALRDVPSQQLTVPVVACGSLYFIGELRGLLQFDTK